MSYGWGMKGVCQGGPTSSARSDEVIFRARLKDDRGSQVKVAGEVGHLAGSVSRVCDP